MTVTLIAVGFPGSGKSSLLKRFEGDYISRDILGTDSKYFKAIRESKANVILLDKCHHSIKSREDVLKQLPKDCEVFWILFYHPKGIEEAAKICIERCKSRGTKNSHIIVNMVKKYWQEPTDGNIIRVNLLLKKREIVSQILNSEF